MLRAYVFFNDTPPPETYTLSLHDALPIFAGLKPGASVASGHLTYIDHASGMKVKATDINNDYDGSGATDRKSTRLNSSHVAISYAVFCLKKKIKLYSSADRH